MSRTARAATIASIVLLGLSPLAAEAQHRAHGGRPQPHHPQHHHFHHRPFGTGLVVAPFVPFVSFAAPSVVYAAPPVYYAPPAMVYASPPVYVAAPYAGPPPVTYAPPVAPAYSLPPAPTHAPSHESEPLRREVVFPSGRYVLRGDGTSTPYTWVWIPNPPSAPPNGMPAGARGDTRPLYAWTDADGVTTWTDRLSKVPPEHRAAARRTF